MSQSDRANDTGDDQNRPVEVQDVLDVAGEDVVAPAEPSEQPALPDFNT